MRRRTIHSLLSLVVAVTLIGVPADMAFGQAAGSDYAEQRARHVGPRAAYEPEAEPYWTAIAEKRRLRQAKRRGNQPIGLDDYVLTQPPLYAGPPRPVDANAPRQ